MTYDVAFYAYHQDRSTSSAEVIVPMVLATWPASSVVDVGCGIGTWLQAFARHGISDYLGIDGDYVPLDMLKIPRGRFRQEDLTKLISVGRRFDIACSLEVAEHLPRECAEQFVTLLTHAAPVVLFSAAIPHQGGTGHVNEQWQSYWLQLFAKRGYQAFDFLRPALHDNSAVEWWYRQNTILYCDAAHSPTNIAPLIRPFDANRVDRGMIDTLVGEIKLLAGEAEILRPTTIRGSLKALNRSAAALRRGVARRIRNLAKR